jgi:hypothetical protein
MFLVTVTCHVSPVLFFTIIIPIQLGSKKYNKKNAWAWTNRQKYVRYYVFDIFNKKFCLVSENKYANMINYSTFPWINIFMDLL